MSEPRGISDSVITDSVITGEVHHHHYPQPLPPSDNAAPPKDPTMKGSGDERESSLAGSFPIRAPVWWGRRGDTRPHPELAGVSGRFILLCHPKSFRRFEGILAKLLRAPKDLRRPLDEMNSLLWELSNGHRTFEEIVEIMDETFTEQIAPAPERTEAALRLLGERGFLLFSKTEFEDVWLTGPGINPNGEIIKINGVDTSPIKGDKIE